MVTQDKDNQNITPKEPKPKPKGGVAGVDSKDFGNLNISDLDIGTADAKKTKDGSEHPKSG